MVEVNWGMGTSIAIGLMALLSLSVFGEPPELGISLELAKTRARQLRNVEYEIELTIPRSAHEKIIGSERIAFELRRPADSLAVDFQSSSESLRAVKVNGRVAHADFVNGHLLFPALKSGRNVLEFDFIAGEAGLRRRDDFLYTLFVPDNAGKPFLVSINRTSRRSTN